MRALDRKLARDLWRLRTQALAIGLVIACGVATFVMSLSTLRSLENTRADYYDRFGFAHIFVHVKRAPSSLAARLAALPGVAQVQTRIVVQVNLDVKGMIEPAVGRLISLPDRGDPILNRLHLRAGRMPEPGSAGEVVVSETFALAHRLHPGNSLLAVINGHRERLQIVGIGLSPEYIYEIQEGRILPDHRIYGVFWMREQELAAAFDMEGAFNDVSVTLSPGALEPAVIGRLDDLLEPYGGLGAYGRRDQPSHRFIENEMQELRGMGAVAPLIFLIVAAFLLNVVMSRLVGTQREQIATLKAFGYSRLEVALHYLALSLLITIIGATLGTAVGYYLGRDLTRIYSRFFHFPHFGFALAADVVLAAWLISIASSVVGVVGAVYRAVSLPPATAMQPEPPTPYRTSLAELVGLARLLTPSAKMIVRRLERHPQRTLLSILGISLAAAVLVLGSFMEDSIEYLIDTVFRRSQRYDLQVNLTEPTGDVVQYELEKLPGVLRCEPFRASPVRLRFGHRQRLVSIIGLPEASLLYRLVDIRRREAETPPDGLLISQKLAELLGAAPGDELTVDVLEGKRPVGTVRIAAVIRDFAGTMAYMDLAALQRLLEEGQTVSGAFLEVDSGQQPQLYRRLKEMPRVSVINIQQTAIDSFRRTIGENLMRMRFFNVLFSSIIAIGVVYNAARISLLESSRDLATLRVLGFSRGEISVILLGELAVLTLVAVPLGCAIGYGFAWGTTSAYDRELFRIPLVVSTRTYGFAAVVVLLAACGAAAVVARQLGKLDLVQVLKTKE